MLKGFPNGTLHLRHVPSAAAEAMTAWTDNPEAVAAVALSVVCIVLAIRPIAEVWSQVVRSVFSWHTNISLERNLSSRRSLNFAAMTLAVPVCTICARFKLPADNIPAALGLAALYFGIRALMYKTLKHKKIDKETWDAAARCFLPGAVITSIAIFLVFGLWHIFGWEEKTIRILLSLAIGLGVIWSVRLAYKILKTHYSRFSTFLYLCALEFLPIAAFAASLVILKH